MESQVTVVHCIRMRGINTFLKPVTIKIKIKIKRELIPKDRARKKCGADPLKQTGNRSCESQWNSSF